MACCSNSKKNKKNNRVTLSPLDLEPSRLSTEERKYYKNLFFHHADGDYVTRENFPTLLGLLGTDISANFAERIFDIFSSDGQKIWLEEYLKYVDLYHHGNERERCLTTFKLMDETGDNKVELKEFENYLELCNFDSAVYCQCQACLL